MKKISTDKKIATSDKYEIDKEALLLARNKQLLNAKESQKNSFSWLTQHSRNFLSAHGSRKEGLISPLQAAYVAIFFALLNMSSCLTASHISTEASFTSAEGRDLRISSIF